MASASAALAAVTTRGLRAGAALPAAAAAAARARPALLRCAAPSFAGAALRLPAVVLQQRFGHARGGSMNDDMANVQHFRVSQLPHPLRAKPHQQVAAASGAKDERDRAVVSLMQNHIWSKHEIDSRLGNLYQHRPRTLSDRCMHVIMHTLYRGFNWITGFQPQNTPVRAVEWRLIVLESFAGVPGFLAAMFRHFRCLRTLQRDHGWIHTLLEEAENERMHLLVCMEMFKANAVTRFLVVAAQIFMTPWLSALYMVHPRAVHRFVGYLEETACLTYANIIHQVETPGTPLHKAWSPLPAPAIAKAYWKLPEEAMWIDCLKCIFADEANHRDVNHTFATMSTDDPNPFVQKHHENAVYAWRLEKEHRSTDIGCHKTLGKREEAKEEPLPAPVPTRTTPAF